MKSSKAGLTGELTVTLTDENGNVKYEETVHNLITTAGDQYYAKQGCNGVGGNTAPTLANGMKLGTSTTAVAKSSTGSSIVTYITGSNIAFTTVTPAVVSGDTGWKITYVTTWNAGVATNASIQEVALVSDQATDTLGAASTTFSRALTGTINKGASDTLTITWVHTLLGA